MPCTRARVSDTGAALSIKFGGTQCALLSLGGYAGARQRRGYLRHTTCLLSTLYELVAVCAAHVVPGCTASQLEYLEASSALRIVRTRTIGRTYVDFLNLSSFPSPHIPS